MYILYGRHLPFDEVANSTDVRHTCCESTVGTEHNNIALESIIVMWQNNRDKLTVARMIQKFSNLNETLEIHYLIQNSPPLSTVMADINTAHAFTLVLLNFILILSP